VVGPNGVERGNRLTHREPSELDERMVDTHRAASDAAVTRVANAADATGLGRSGVERTTNTVTGVGAGRPREGRIEEGADHAVFSGGARIDGQIFTGTSSEVVAHTVISASHRAVGAVENRGRVERRFNAQVTTQLDAGVSAGDIEETRTIQGADP